MQFEIRVRLELSLLVAQSTRYSFMADGVPPAPQPLPVIPPGVPPVPPVQLPVPPAQLIVYPT